jgi:GH24 family phage-related lysozyme (muramidase)
MERALVVPFKEQTFMTVHSIAHFIGASKYSVSRLHKTWQQTSICVTTLEEEMWTELSDNTPDLQIVD